MFGWKGSISTAVAVSYFEVVMNQPLASLTQACCYLCEKLVASEQQLPPSKQEQTTLGSPLLCSYSWMLRSTLHMLMLPAHRQQCCQSPLQTLPRIRPIGLAHRPRQTSVFLHASVAQQSVPCCGPASPCHVATSHTCSAGVQSVWHCGKGARMHREKIFRESKTAILRARLKPPTRDAWACCASGFMSIFTFYECIQ